MMRSDQPLLALYAKKPTPGKVKTRLQSHCNARSAAWIADQFIAISVRRAIQFWPGEVVLVCTPDEQHKCFEEMRSRYGIGIQVQQGTDLGERLECSIRVNLQRFPAVAIVGCDVPHLEQDVYQEIASKLVSGQVVLGKCYDGGFYCVGANQTLDRCFQNITWSTSEVFEHCLRKLVTCGFDVYTDLPVYRDIDEWEDLEDVAQANREIRKLLQAVLDQSWIE